MSNPFFDRPILNSPYACPARHWELDEMPMFRNHDEDGNALPRPRTLLIDSEQLESGEALDDHFRAMAADEIERFRARPNDEIPDLCTTASIRLLVRAGR